MITKRKLKKYLINRYKMEHKDVCHVGRSMDRSETLDRSLNYHLCRKQIYWEILKLMDPKIEVDLSAYSN